MTWKLKSREKELYVTKGATFRDTITLVNETNNVGVNITGTTITGAYWQSPIRANSELEFQFLEHDTANGVWNVFITAANTSTSNTGKFVYSFHWTDTDSDVYRVQHGVVVVDPDRS